MLGGGRAIVADDLDLKPSPWIHAIGACEIPRRRVARMSVIMHRRSAQMSTGSRRCSELLSISPCDELQNQDAGIEFPRGRRAAPLIVPADRGRGRLCDDYERARGVIFGHTSLGCAASRCV